MDDQRAAKLLAQEEEIFQTARLINCGWFGSAVFSDYFSSILGLVRQGSSWSLNPFGVCVCIYTFKILADVYLCVGNPKGGPHTL